MATLHAAHAEDPASPTCPPTAQAVDPAEAAAGMRMAQDRGMLWRLEKDGRTSWLYGTLHVAERGWMYPGPATLRALRRADRIALELDMLDPVVNEQLRAAIMARPGAPALPPALAQRLADASRAACVGQTLAGMRPEMQALTLLALSGRAQGLDPAYGIDMVLAGFARGQGKPVVSLETPAQQMALLLFDDPAETAKRVDEALQSLGQKNARQMLSRLTRAWAEGRLEELAHYADWCECLDTAAQRKAYDDLVIGRNPGLALRVAEIHDAGQAVFAAVGALHMAGPQGLPALLAARGFSVERVPFRPLRPAISAVE